MTLTKCAALPVSIVLRYILIFTLLFGSFPGFSQGADEENRLVAGKEVSKPSKLNNRNFQKNLEKYAHQLDLSSKQVKKINRIERKYGRKETKLARKPDTKKRELRAVGKEKRERLIAVLDYEQQQKLQQLSRSGFWDFLKARN